MRYRFALVLLLAVAACRHPSIFAPSSDDASLGLPPAGAPAIVFAAGVVSTGDVFASTFTPDGRTVVFTKFAPPRMTLMSSSRVGDTWSAPITLPFSGTFRDLDPAFSPDGKRLYFSSWRPTSTSMDTTNASETWYVDRAATGWSAPVHLSPPINSAAQDYYPSLTRGGTIYFDSFRSTPPRRLVYRAIPRGDGAVANVEALDATINADSGASNLFVDAEERYIIFGAVRPEGHGGMDLYVSWRRGTSWTPPLNLGDRVNTAATEFCPFVSRDGKYLYFTRVTTVNGVAQRNIFVVRFDALLDSLRR